ncbi:hypothetical protein D9615_010035 [Tricholomella constricta]|uniref:Uncharacterized protein n=1 Tax=Tricholomella constricta TaxID=117010 RepID=A0A8H5GUD1_9AGAR|nr:hypothetical protein D9615_010035 [Tricholomella constricta]
MKVNLHPSIPSVEKVSPRRSPEVPPIATLINHTGASPSPTPPPQADSPAPHVSPTTTPAAPPDVQPDLNLDIDQPSPFGSRILPDSASSPPSSPPSPPPDSAFVFAAAAGPLAPLHLSSFPELEPRRVFRPANPPNRRAFVLEHREDDRTRARTRAMTSTEIAAASAHDVIAQRCMLVCARTLSPIDSDTSEDTDLQEDELMDTDDDSPTINIVPSSNETPPAFETDPISIYPPTTQSNLANDVVANNTSNAAQETAMIDFLNDGSPLNAAIDDSGVNTTSNELQDSANNSILPTVFILGPSTTEEAVSTTGDAAASTEDDEGMQGIEDFCFGEPSDPSPSCIFGTCDDTGVVPWCINF